MKNNTYHNKWTLQPRVINDGPRSMICDDNTYRHWIIWWTVVHDMRRLDYGGAYSESLQFILQLLLYRIFVIFRCPQDSRHWVRHVVPSCPPPPLSVSAAKSSALRRRWTQRWRWTCSFASISTSRARLITRHLHGKMFVALWSQLKMSHRHRQHRFWTALATESLWPLLQILNVFRLPKLAMHLLQILSVFRLPAMHGRRVWRTLRMLSILCAAVWLAWRRTSRTFAAHAAQGRAVDWGSSEVRWRHILIMTSARFQFFNRISTQLATSICSLSLSSPPLILLRL